MGFTRSPLWDLESNLRIVVGPIEDDISYFSKQYNSVFITYELSPGIYSIKDISEVVNKMEATLQIEYDDTSMETKLILTRFGDTFGTLRLDERFFLNTLLGFTPYWYLKIANAFHADSPGVYTSEEILNLITIIKIHLESDFIDNSVVTGTREPILFSFVLDKSPGCKIICEPETMNYKKLNKSVFISITFCLEDKDPKEVYFNGETLTFTLQLIKIWTIRRVYEKLKLAVIALVKNTTLAQKKLLVR